jgi:hypothetical protein
MTPLLRGVICDRKIQLAARSTRVASKEVRMNRCPWNYF